MMDIGWACLQTVHAFVLLCVDYLVYYCVYLFFVLFDFFALCCLLSSQEKEREGKGKGKERKFLTSVRNY
jgi:hypothetical protein